MVKLYIADVSCLENDQTFDDHLCKVNEQRRAKVLRCKNKEDKKRSLLAGALLAFGLEKQGLCYNELEFSVTPEGKPYLVSNSELFFSLSHSGKYAVCVIADQNVGVDVECRHRKLLVEGNQQKALSVAKQILSDEEYKELNSQMRNR